MDEEIEDNGVIHCFWQDRSNPLHVRGTLRQFTQGSAGHAGSLGKCSKYKLQIISCRCDQLATPFSCTLFLGLEHGTRGSHIHLLLNVFIFTLSSEQMCVLYSSECVLPGYLSHDLDVDSLFLYQLSLVVLAPLVELQVCPLSHFGKTSGQLFQEASF